MRNWLMTRSRCEAAKRERGGGSQELREGSLDPAE